MSWFYLVPNWLIMFNCDIIYYYNILQINAAIGSSKLWKDDVTVGSGWTPWNPFAGIWILGRFYSTCGYFELFRPTIGVLNLKAGKIKGKNGSLFAFSTVYIVKN